MINWNGGEQWADARDAAMADLNKLGHLWRVADAKLTREAFAEFCESKPADEEYDYYDNKNCALGQYLQRLGYTSVKVLGCTWRADNVESHEIEDGISGILEEVTAEHGSTFGNLARCLRKGPVMSRNPFSPPAGSIQDVVSGLVIVEAKP